VTQYRSSARWRNGALLHWLILQPASAIAWTTAHFFKSTVWLVDALVEKVTASHSGKLAWDLFAGIGLFARQLTANFARVVAVESAPSATAALEQNLRGTTGLAVKAETLAFVSRSRMGEKPDFIVVDPPRTGLGAETCALLAEIAAPAVTYVSCDPATLARDLRALTGSTTKFNPSPSLISFRRPFTWKQ